MSCYLRHITGILDEAGIHTSRENRQQIDQAIHQIVGVTYKNCPTTWKKLKEELAGNEQKRRTFIDRLRNTINSDLNQCTCGMWLQL